MLAIPSLSEAFGIVAIEGLASGLPVVASDVGGLPEIITPECGILFQAGDHIKLSKAILKIGENKDLWVKLNRNAVKRSEYFSIQRMAENYKSLLELI